LPAATREAAAAAAALSHPTPALVAAVAGEASLGPALAGRVFEVDGTRLWFSHPLLASAAYEAIDPLARRALHRRLATVVPDEDEGAHHLSLATAEPDAAVADALERAADHAFRRGATAAAAELTADELAEGARALERKVRRYTPRVLAMVGIGAYRAAFGRPRAKLGLQEETIGATRIWVLPNPSGLNANYQQDQLVTLFRDLRQVAG
jgi:G:T/U-mismatch repair DNA glycosylase